MFLTLVFLTLLGSVAGKSIVFIRSVDEAFCSKTESGASQAFNEAANHFAYFRKYASKAHLQNSVAKLQKCVREGYAPGNVLLEILEIALDLDAKKAITEQLIYGTLQGVSPSVLVQFWRKYSFSKHLLDDMGQDVWNAMNAAVEKTLSRWIKQLPKIVDANKSLELIEAVKEQPWLFMQKPVLKALATMMEKTKDLRVGVELLSHQDASLRWFWGDQAKSPGGILVFVNKILGNSSEEPDPAARKFIRSFKKTLRVVFSMREKSSRLWSSNSGAIEKLRNWIQTRRGGEKIQLKEEFERFLGPFFSKLDAYRESMVV